MSSLADGSSLSSLRSIAARLPVPTANQLKHPGVQIHGGPHGLGGHLVATERDRLTRRHPRRGDGCIWRHARSVSFAWHPRWRCCIPRYWVVVKELPLTPSGKVQKFRLREQFAAGQTGQR